MALVATNRTVSTLEGVTRQQLMSELGHITGLCQFGTATAGGIDNLIDTTQLQSAQFSPSEWTGAWIRISYNASGVGTAPERDIRSVYEYQPELGKILVATAFSSGIGVGDTYELWKINPSIVLDIIDRALQNDLYVPCWSMLSEIDDFDMEASGTAAWTGANSTLAKVSTGVRLSNSGRQWLTVLATAASGYAKSGILDVVPNQSYIASALCRAEAASTTASLQIWDETNNALIKSITSQLQTPNRLYTTFAAPATCYQVTYRPTTVESGKTTDWGDVVNLNSAAPDVPLPWWMKRRGQVEGIFQWMPRQGITQSYDPALTGEVDTRWDIYRNYNGNGFRATARIGGTILPLFILGRRNETAYANDTVDKKMIDIPTFLACIAFKLYKLHSQPIVTGLLDAANFKSMLEPAQAEWERLAQENTENLNTVITSDTPFASFKGRYNYGA